MPLVGVVGVLLLAAAVGLGHRALHRAGDLVGVEDHPAVDVARGAADGLDQRGLAAQEAFLVGVEDRDQRAFRNVEALAQQVDADQRVERAEPQVADDLDALQRVDVGVHVAHADALLVQVFGQVLGHALGQHRDQRAIALGARPARTSPTRSSTWVRAGRTSTGGSISPVGRITCSANTPPACVDLPRARASPTRDGLRAHRVPFLEAQRPVVHAGRQAEAVFGERRLAAEVAAEHAADLRHGDVALVDEHQRVVGHVFEQRRRRLAGLAAGEIARIVLDAGAAAGRLHHFEIEEWCAARAAALPAAGRRRCSCVEPPLQLGLDALDRLHQRRPRRDVVRVGVDLDEFQLVGLVAGERIELVDRLDLVAEQRTPARRGPRSAPGRCR